MEIHQLEQFKTIAESNTMREAAEKLYISQPALSQNLKKLENELGCSLFDRSHNQLALTPYGEILLEHAHRILFDLKEVTEKIEAKKQEESRIIRIGSFYLPLNLFALPQLANALPQYKFEVTVGRPEMLSKSLIDKKIDIAFLPHQCCPAHFANQPIYQESLLLSVPSTSCLSDRETITSDELHETEMLVPSDFLGLSSWYEEALSDAGVPASQVEHMPIKEYLENMDRTERAHFTTSLMAMFSGSGNIRPSIPIESNVSPRVIAVAFHNSESHARDVIDYILEKQDELISNHAFLPFLMYQDRASNLSMRFDS